MTDFIPIPPLTDKKMVLMGDVGKRGGVSVCVCIYMFQRLVSLGVIQMTKRAQVKCSQTSLTNKTGLYNWAGM